MRKCINGSRTGANGSCQLKNPWISGVFAQFRTCSPGCRGIGDKLTRKWAGTTRPALGYSDYRVAFLLFGNDSLSCRAIPANQISASSPLRSSRSSSLADGPLGCLAPISHCRTVDTLVLSTEASTAWLIL